MRFNLWERRTEKTEVASVEPTTEPMSIPSHQLIPRARWQKRPVRAEVRKTPALERRMARPATGRAVFQLVPKPP